MSIKQKGFKFFKNSIMYFHYLKQIKLLREIQKEFDRINSMDDVYYIEEEIYKINKKIINL